ncbi:hypothetical protein V1281_001908 [Nitrobacteraceae bacterium AZCC 2161]
MADAENRPPARANGTSMDGQGDRREVKSRQKAPQRTSDRPHLAEPVEIAKLWKSRDRTQSIVLTLKEFEGHIFLDCRVFGTDRQGKSVPTPKGITVGRLRLPDFFKAIRKAEKRALDLGLIDGDEQ